MDACGVEIVEEKKQMAKIDADVMRLARSIVAITGESISDLLSQSLRPILRDQYRELTVAELASLEPQKKAGKSRP